MDHLRKLRGPIKQEYVIRFFPNMRPELIKQLQTLMFLDISFLQNLKSILKEKLQSKRQKEQKESTVTGLEPAIPRSEVWCLIHQATRSQLALAVTTDVQFCFLALRVATTFKQRRLFTFSRPVPNKELSWGNSLSLFVITSLGYYGLSAFHLPFRTF